jgi:hypothetical protein
LESRSKRTNKPVEPTLKMELSKKR